MSSATMLSTAPASLALDIERATERLAVAAHDDLVGWLRCCRAGARRARPSP